MKFPFSVPPENMYNIKIYGTLKRLLSLSIIQYVLVGIANTCCGLVCIMLFLNLLAWDYWTSTLLGNGMAMLLSYHLNGKWTFLSHTRSKLKGLALFIGISLIVYFLSYLISLFGKWMFHNAGNVKPLSALIGLGIYMILGYLGHKMITFR
jgi:putative flippase GtrA